MNRNKTPIGSKATERPNTKVKLAVKFTDEELASSAVGQLALFCNESYSFFIPRSRDNQNYQKPFVPIQQKCVSLITQASSKNWDELITENFRDNDRKTANDFFYHVSRKYNESPEIVVKKLNTNLNKFVELADYALLNNNTPDLIKLTEFGDVIDYFNDSEERTFLFLSELTTVLDEKSRQMLTGSYGYRQIISWGASEYLKEFGLRLQKRFKITRTAIKTKATEDLLIDLGETEVNLKHQINILETENQELKNKIDDVLAKSFQESVFKLAKTLQEQPQPVLDQIFSLHQKLNEISEAENELSLSARESLSVLITLEDLLKAFQTLDITKFPANINQSFVITGEQLSEYTYIEGSSFSNSEDKKIVRCVQPGWRVGERIITPARVKEVTE